LRALPPADTPISLNPTKHWDLALVSHYYNWKPGPYTGAYINVMLYQLKPDAPDDAVSTLSETVVVPILEKLLADGTILEYEVDTEAIHTDAPVIGPSFDSFIDYTQHRDELLKGNGAYK
jgi:hypothetical protein